LIPLLLPLSSRPASFSALIIYLFVMQHNKSSKVPLSYVVKEDETQFIVFANVPYFVQGTLAVCVGLHLSHSQLFHHHPSSIIHHPSSIIHHPSSIIHHPSSIIHHPSSSSGTDMLSLLATTEQHHVGRRDFLTAFS
jgi:hypothetical protein